MKKLLLVFLSFSFLSAVVAQEKNIWTLQTGIGKIIPNKAVARLSFPSIFKLFSLNIEPLKQDLFSVAGNRATSHSTVISLPNADGQIELYEVFEASNFEPALQAQFPEIRAFSGKGITDKYATLKLSISPQGIQTMVFRTDKENEFIEAYSQDNMVYAVYRSQKTKSKIPWNCSTVENEMVKNLDAQIPSTFRPESSTGELKTIRLAQSCTAEYANFFGASTAGNAADQTIVLTAFNNTLTRCNGVYEKDLALHLNLIANTTAVLYYDAATDPYATVSNALLPPASWNDSLQTTLTNIIGAANYDIGHLFGASGGGGNAGCIGCVCSDGNKGSGITSPPTGSVNPSPLFPPAGDDFDIGYVVHEIGHQLGATHTYTFESEGGSLANSSQMEVGSGITIMGYAGITNQDDSTHSIPYYHAVSIKQIQDTLATKTCPITTNISATNATPVVALVNNYIIPLTTPFALTGSATDANPGDALTYQWEQFDPSTSLTGNNSVASPTKASGPNWLSFNPTLSPTRILPRLSTILAGLFVTPTLGGDAVANVEALSSVARTLNFRLTVRDNSPYSSNPPLKVGQTAFTDIAVTVSNAAGPFGVSSPNTAVSWEGLTSKTITWTVNGTDLDPIFCAYVNILLSTDGGFTWPITLATNTPNDGSEVVTIPNNITTTARVKVESVGNIFFDISNADFTITSTQLPDLIVQTPQVIPSTIPAGTSSTASFFIKNQSTGNAVTSFTSIWLSQDQNFDGGPTDIFLADMPTPALNAGQTSPLLSAQITIPPSTTGGTWYIMFAADGTGIIPESNETNNSVFVPVNVTALTPIQQDSLILVALYNSTGGPNWTNKTNWLTGAPVSTWFGIGMNNNGRVINIDLYNNNLTGTIPSSITNLSSLVNLILNTNHLSGSIPSNIGDLVNLQSLRLDGNQLTGTIPSSIVNLVQLSWLSLRVNQLTGSLPTLLGNLTNMYNLQFDLNQLTGTIPSSIGNMQNLNILGLSGNQFSGTIPASLGNLSHLTQFRLDDNQLTGTIPPELGNIISSPGLGLFVNKNQLTGSIPSTIGGIPNLLILSLADNQLTGEIPLSFTNLTSLTNLYLNNNQLSGTLSALANLTGLAQLTIDNNKFTFAGLETLVQQVNSISYSQQANIPLLENSDCKLYVSAGGTLANNTYNWYRSGQLVATKIGDSTYMPAIIGDYYVVVSNSIATQLALFSDLLINVSPKPELGPARLQLFCPVTYADVSHLFDDTLNLHPEYSIVAWTTISGIPFNPTLATYGNTYRLIVQNLIGCQDTGIVKTALYPIKNILPAQPQTLLATQEVTDAFGWTNYYSSSNVLLLSLKKNGNNIGSIGDGTFQVKVAATGGAGSGNAIQINNPLFTNSNGSYIMNRYWNVTATNQPTSSVGVRFYYNTQDLADVQGSVPAINSHLQLRFYKLYGGNADPTTNFAGATDLIDLSSGPIASSTSWVYTFLGCNEHQAEFKVDNFSGGGGGATINGNPFGIPVVLPVITNVSPLSAASNSPVTISGNNFTGAVGVSFGGIDATSYSVISPNTIIAIVGPGASGNVSVSTPAGTASFSGFNFISALGITFYPTSGPVGTTVIITGNNFSSTPANNTVYFGAVKAVVSAATTTSLTVTVPAGASYQPISITTNNLTVYSTKAFTVTFPGGGTGFTSTSFETKVDYTSGAAPVYVAVADINGDGKPDMVTANYGMNADGNSISVLKNTSIKGIISFASKVDFLTGTGPWSVAAGDLDGDGKPDLVVANETSNTISVLRNTSSAGTISFAPRIDFTTGSLAESILISDLNADGKPDIAVTNYGSNTVSVFTNNSTVGLIHFSPKSDFVTGSTPEGIAFGDLDSDGKPDLLISNINSNSVSILRNTSTTGTISFAAKFDVQTGGNPWGIAVADIDGDGKLDFVSANNNFFSYSVSVLRNTSSIGIISFAPKLDFAAGNSPVGISINDMDGDGKPDIAVSCVVTGTNSLTLLRNTSAAGVVSFESKVNFGTTSDPFNLSAGDLDGDGKPDIAATNYLSASVSILRNKIGEGELCSGGNTTITSNITGASYQWQVNTGTGFNNISDNGNYFGTNTKVLQVNNPLSSWYGYQYRCMVNGVPSNITTLKISNIWTGAVSTAWENPQNWSCGKLPDINSDVIINSGIITLNSNAACRTLNIKPLVVITIKNGFNLFVAH